MGRFEGKKAALHTLGCKVNAYETDAMRAMLEEAGFEIVPFDRPADVYLINTCSVTNVADRKSRQMIHRARKLNPSAIVIAAGCYVQTASHMTGLQIDADLVIGNGRKKDLIPEIEKIWAGREQKEREQILDVPELFADREYEQLSLPRLEGRTRAYIKVQDGCNMFCSYCIIPYARGRIRSRSVADIRQEIGELAGKGTKEVVLTGIHLSSYGVDLSGEDGEEDYPSSAWQERSKLFDLIEEVSRIGGIERIRLGSLEPTIITEKNAERMSRMKKLCPHFHLSLQSGCDSVLRRMNRRYTVGDYREKVQILRSCFQDPAITTDVIAGFPGETEEEFRQTAEFLRETGLYETHIFPYSRRSGTKAASMPGQLTEARKAERVRILTKIGEENRKAFIGRWLGREAEVLVEERADGHAPNASGLRRQGETEESAASAPSGEGTVYAGYTREYIRVCTRSESDIRGAVRSGRLRLENSVLFV